MNGRFRLFALNRRPSHALLSVVCPAPKVHTSEKGFDLVTFGQDMSVRSQQGFTLVEALIVVAILSIVAAIALPSFRQVQAAARANAAAVDMASAITEARALAVGRQRPVTLTANGAAAGNRWGQGWIIAFTVPLAGVGNLAEHRGLPETSRITSAPDIQALVFQPNGLVQTVAGVPIGTITFQACDESSDSETGRNVVLTRFGRVSTMRHADSSVCN